MVLAGLVASPIASASENGNGSISATFPLGSSVLSDAQKAAIKKTVASSGSDVSFIVTGTAGKLPGISDRWVQRLAKKRAQAIKAYIVSLGVSKENVTTQTKTTEIGIVPKSTGSQPTSASTVAVTNSAGTGSGSGSGPACTPVTTPGAPTSAGATAGNAQSVVSWTAPTSTGGCAIPSYTVTSSPGSFTCTTASTSCTVTGLTNGTAYTFTVTATNSVGTGSASTASSSITPVTTPGAPTSVSATAGNAQSVVSWTAPASTGGATITGYTATSNPSSLTCTTASTSCTVTGLTNGTAYTFTVTATNSAGTGSASAASSSITPTAPVYAVGETGPGGGIVYYVDNVGFSCGPTRAGTCNYLEVAPTTWRSGGDGSFVFAVASKQTTDITDITNNSSAYNNASGIGLGYINSLAIVTQNGAYNSVSNVYAAGAARAYQSTVSSVTYSDWYLPTTAELNLLCQWNRGVTQSVTTACTGGALNTGTGTTLGDSRYRSSSEVDGSNAWVHDFDPTSQVSANKSFSYPVRPIRAF